jgi:hypothetical protein
MLSLAARIRCFDRAKPSPSGAIFKLDSRDDIRRLVANRIHIVPAQPEISVRGKDEPEEIELMKNLPFGVTSYWNPA